MPESGPDFTSPTEPNVARIYDYLLGGKDNYAVDRKAADALLKIIPDALTVCRENRLFLQRAVQYMADRGIRQFIDIGTGLPTMGSVHEIAQGIDADSRVVYVDYDHVVITHARALLANHNERVAVIEADFREPDKIIHGPQVSDLIDFSDPVGILMVAILHFVRDDERPYDLVNSYKQVMAPGSYLAVTHITDDAVGPDVSKAAQNVYADAAASPVPRSYDGILRFFDDLSVVNPGLVEPFKWRSGRTIPPTRTLIYSGIGRKERRQQAT